MTRADAERVVLAADDDPASLLLARQIVELAGLTCLTAIDGRDALEQTLRHRPGLVLIDMNMPHMTGIEAARAIRAGLGENAPVIVAVSSECSADTRQAAREAGIAEYLLKPVGIEEIFQALETHLPHPAA